MKAALPVDTGSPQPRSVRSSGLQFKAPLPRDKTPVAGPSNGNGQSLFHPSTPRASQQQRQEEHFVPLSQADRNVLKGTGFEDMTSEQLAAMMDAADDEDEDMTGPTIKVSAARTESPSFRWSPTPEPATQARQQARARAPILPPMDDSFADAERLEMELDPDAEEDQLDGDSFVPATQMPRQAGSKVSEGIQELILRLIHHKGVPTTGFRRRLGRQTTFQYIAVHPQPATTACSTLTLLATLFPCKSLIVSTFRSLVIILPTLSSTSNPPAKASVGRDVGCGMLDRLPSPS